MIFFKNIIKKLSEKRVHNLIFRIIILLVFSYILKIKFFKEILKKTTKTKIACKFSKVFKSNININGSL